MKTLVSGSWILRMEKRDFRPSGLLSLLLLLTLPVTAEAQFTYEFTNGSITITGYTGPGGAVVIPGDVNGVPVTDIGDWAFSGCTSLTSITLPSSLTSIQESAFNFCTNLASVTIPNSVTSIGEDAFFGCTSLSSITIPNGVSSIQDGVFFECTSLASVTIPEGVTSIGAWAFDGCASLASVTIPEGVTSIGDGAFDGCASLASVTIPNSVTNIVDPFEGCTRLASVTIPAVGGGLWQAMLDVDFNCPLTNFTIGTGVTSIGAYAFESSPRLGTSVTIGNGVSSIGTFAFAFCYSLKSLTIPGSVTSIGPYAFGDCPLTSVTIGNGVTSIAEGAFAGCNSLTAAYFQGDAPSADSTVFANDDYATVYYLAGTTGWGPTFGGCPTMLWHPQVQPRSFGVTTNQFRFNITGSTNLVVVVAACTNLANPVWSPLQTVTVTGGSFYFTDPQWTNYPARFYRIQWP